MADSTHHDLDALLEGVRRGAPEAFRGLYESLADGLNSFAAAILRDANASQDVVQQAFLELVTKADTIKGDGRSLRAWMYKSVRFRCLDELRRRARRGESLMGEIPEPLQPRMATDGEPTDPRLVAALEHLNDDQRSILFLRHVAGLSGHETAKVMGTSRAAVFASAARAERRLRALLGGTP